MYIFNLKCLCCTFFQPLGMGSGLSSLNAVISTNESTRKLSCEIVMWVSGHVIYNSAYMYLQIPSETHHYDLDDNIASFQFTNYRHEVKLPRQIDVLLGFCCKIGLNLYKRVYFIKDLGTYYIVSFCRCATDLYHAKWSRINWHKNGHDWFAHWQQKTDSVEPHIHTGSSDSNWCILD